MDCANDRYCTKEAEARAAAGILDPQPVVLRSGLLYRYGSGLENARTGSWWLDADQYQRVAAWALARGLDVAHAARVLTIVLHEWGKHSVLKSNMRVLVRAEILRPLRAFKGLAKPQAAVKQGDRYIEMIDPAQGTDTDIVQLYIPGLAEANLPEGTLRYGKPVLIGIGASHIFGVPLVPAGTPMH